jgi:hypothetical protein
MTPPAGWVPAPDLAVAVAGEPVLWILRPACIAAPQGRPGGDDAPDGFALGPGLTLHHDGAPGTVRVVRDAGGPALAIATSGFAGRYLSFAAALPAGGDAGIDRNSILGLSARIGAAGAVGEAGANVRLNIRAGPNTERWMKPLAAGPRGPLAEFDLGRLPRGHEPEGGWLDLFVAPPAEGRVPLTDLVIWHRLRANL